MTGLAVGDLLGGVAAAHHRRHTQFAGDNGSMAGAPASVGDDGGGALHDRLPVRVGHVGDQHVAGLHPVHFPDARDDLGRAGADAVADAAALGQVFAGPLQGIALDHPPAAALHRLRPRLQDVELAVDTVLGPFDVHRAVVVLLDDQRLAGQFLHLRVADAEAPAFVLRHLLGAHRGALGRCVRVYHADCLAAQVAAHDGRAAGVQGRLVDIELVRVHRALHHHLAEAVAGGDEHQHRGSRSRCRG